MKKFIAFLMAALMLVCLVSCGEPKEKEFTSEKGLTITLTESFKEAQYEGYTICYDSPTVAIFVLKEDFSLLAGLENYTLAQYAELVHNANSSKKPTAITEVEGLTCFEYTYLNTDDITDYSYFTTMFKGDDAFWTVQFCSKTDKYDSCKAEMIKYAKSVDVTKD
ncbi:MAG: hypothetical protein IJY88_04025 [Clostridia bacterium]|nr:hypothetical protein [Clostridia bacterium]